MITSLQLKNFRAVDDLAISFPASSSSGDDSTGFPSPTVLFFGANAQGKTTLLEGLHLLLTGRSFRTGILDQLIGPKDEGMLARGTLSLEIGNDRSAHHIGMQKRKRAKLQASLDGAPIKSSMALARLLPVQVVDHQSLQLVLGEPGVRRRFLDWGAFHVEHQYGTLFKKWHSALTQRNALLKIVKRGKELNGEQELRAWTETYATLSVKVARVRERYFAMYIAYLGAQSPEGSSPASTTATRTIDLGTSGLKHCSLTLKHGFAFDADLPDAELVKIFLDELAAKRDVEVVLGRTHSGPQRAELVMNTDGQVAKEILSRGQCKLLAALLLLHQVRHLRQCSHAAPAIVLVDDITAELDNERAADLLQKLSSACSQLFVTALAADQGDLPPFLADLHEAPSTATFHVEHGGVRAVTKA
ncbi:MAG: hypothetical protein CME36_14155 [unclassified Hahellaceae]|nr:hypothetical protein [Hahellaceae bacterium]|tara:strand:- start:27728 stop:28978 length:1251 start_codon:yes stop_codon:yes gene_type:complete